MHREEKSYYWVKPLIILLFASLSVFFFNRAIDFFFHKELVALFAGRIFSYKLDTILNSFGNMGEVVTSVLGIEITAIAIIVQLAANKYSSKIMELFITDNVNFLIVALYVIAGTNTILLANTMTENHTPYFSIFITLILLVASIIIVIPHFTYVFNFLRPTHFLKKIEIESKKIIGDIAEEKRCINGSREDLAYKIDFIGDVALNSYYQSDRAVTLLALNTLKNILDFYIPLKNSMPDDWFRLSGKENLDPDFADYSQFVMKRIEEQHVLLERKIFRLYEMIFIKAKATQRDIASGVLLYSRLIFGKAANANDSGVLWTIIQYFNSFLRSSITSHDPRSAFNTLEHYRLMAEKIIDKDSELVEKIYFYFKYYGQEANKYKVFFILETAAHDLYVVTRLAYKKNAANFERLLDLFLTLDQPIEEDGNSQNEISLIGVRIAQAKLAAFFIHENRLDYARKIYQDMLVEPQSRIEKIKEIIFETDTSEFWEITPRGINFYYVEEEDKKALKTFFAWFSENNTSDQK